MVGVMEPDAKAETPGDPWTATPAADSDVEPQPAVFRADARLRLWGAGGCAAFSLGFTAAGYCHALQPVFAGPLAAAGLVSGCFARVSRAAAPFPVCSRHFHTTACSPQNVLKPAAVPAPPRNP